MIGLAGIILADARAYCRCSVIGTPSTGLVAGPVVFPVVVVARHDRCRGSTFIMLFALVVVDVPVMCTVAVVLFAASIELASAFTAVGTAPAITRRGHGGYEHPHHL